MVPFPMALTPINAAHRKAVQHGNMHDFPLNPPLLVKDTPRPRRLRSFVQARAYVDEEMRRGRPPPWREVWHRLDTVETEDAAIEAIGALRELLDTEDLLERPELPLVEPETSAHRK
jgi:hypothetical protein